MASTFFVLSDGGEVKVSRLHDGTYAADVIASDTIGEHVGTARGCATIAFNEGGFRGRQWEVTSLAIGGSAATIGDDQFSTLREAAKMVGDRAASYARSRALAKSLGIGAHL